MVNRILVPDLCLIDLNKCNVDLMQIQNRRFMYHPSGLLLLGEEDTVNMKGLFKSHAEEHYEAEERFQIKLPPYDDFIKGWIGVGKSYPYGIVHFAPHIPDGHIGLFDKAFSFVEVVQENGFSYRSVLRGFPGKWEQTIGEMLGKEPPLEEKIRKANLFRSSERKTKIKLNENHER